VDFRNWRMAPVVRHYRRRFRPISLSVWSHVPDAHFSFE
jgi:hypothetical protein